MKKDYPVIMTTADETVLVEVPDFDIRTEGKNLEDAINMARDAIGIAGISMQDYGEDIPEPSTASKIKTYHGAFAEYGKGTIVMVDIDFDLYRKQTRYEDNKTFYNRFATDLLLAFYDEKKNTVISSWSVLSMLMLVASATAGATRDEVIKFTGGDRILKSGPQSSDKFLSANAVCSNTRMKSAFRARHKDEMIRAAELDRWIRKQSAGMIDPAIPENVSTVLLNITRFADTWMDGYEDIKVRNFYNSDGTVTKVPMMRSTEYGYLETEEAEGFVKWYEGGFRFLALMPKTHGKKAMKSFLHNLDLNDIFNHGANIDEVHVSIPEFDADYEVDLKDFCRQKGIKKVFSNEADFSPMSYDHIQLDQIIHKVHIEVDREGTRAAGLSAGVGLMGPPMERKKRTVTLNRPFVYVILDGRAGIPMFAGVVNNLQERAECPVKI